MADSMVAEAHEPSQKTDGTFNVDDIDDAACLYVVSRSWGLNYIVLESLKRVEHVFWGNFYVPTDWSE